MADALDFEGRIVAITGAGNGLGRAYALDLARRGASIVVNDLGVERDGSGESRRAAEKVVEEIVAAGGKAAASFDNVADEAGGRAITETALKTFGRIDAVIANAGILRDKSYYKLSAAEFEAVLDVHLRGAFFTTQPAFRAMKDRGEGGRIVLTTSPVALFGTFGQPNYVAAKLGVVGLATSVAMEGARTNIFANCVAPMAATRLTPGMSAEPGPAHPFAPRRVAPFVAYLCHGACQSNGGVYVAGHNYYARAAMVLAQGWAAPGESVDVGDIAAHWNEIASLDQPQMLASAAEIAPLLRRKTPYLAPKES